MQKFQLNREISVFDQTYDVVVAGGGPAGAISAIIAGRKGAKVLLIEAMGCLGGMGTSGLVTAFDPMADGKRRLVRGLMGEIIDTMYTRGFLQPDIDPDTFNKNYHEWTPYSAEGFKIILDELTTEANVDIKYFTKVIDVDMDTETHTLKGVIIHNIEGYAYIPGKMFIDATGDAVLAKLCGVICREPGIDTEKPMPSTLCALLGGIDWKRAEEHGVDLVAYNKPGYQHAQVQKALEDGFFTQYDKHFPGAGKTGRSLACMNAGHVFGLNSLKCKDLTDGMIKGRQIVQEYVAFYKEYVTGFENVELVTTGSLMGVRESRRIVGEYELNVRDYLARKQFPDQIGVFNKFIDIHPYDCTEEEINRFNDEAFASGRLPEGTYFGIPYGIIVPKGFKNLWVPGRAASADIQVQGSIRVMPACAMMGQAAGSAAVQCLQHGQSADNLNTRVLIETLRKDNAFLPQEELSDNMTRAGSS